LPAKVSEIACKFTPTSTNNPIPEKYRTHKKSILKISQDAFILWCPWHESNLRHMD